MNHLDEGTIHAWLDGALEATRAREVDAHVAGCSSCSAAVAEARGLIAGASRILTGLDDVPSGVVPKTTVTAPRASWRGGRGAQWVTGIAAALMLAIGVTTWNREAVVRQLPESGTLPKPSALPSLPTGVSADVASPAVPAPASVAAPVREVPARQMETLRRQSAAPRPVASPPAARLPQGRAEGTWANAERGCYVVDVRGSALQVRDVVLTAETAAGRAAAPAAVTAAENAAVRETATAVAPTAVGAAAAAAAPAAGRASEREAARTAEIAAETTAFAPSEASRTGIRGVTRLDAVARRGGFIARNAVTGEVIGEWSVVSGDSVRLDLGGGTIVTLPRTGGTGCPQRGP